MHTWDYQTFEVTANCSPARFAAIAEDFGLQLQQAWLRDGVRLPLIPSITATVADGDLVRVDIESNVFSTIIHALPRGDGRTQVRVEPGAGWGAEESWAALWAELARLGYVEQETSYTVKPLFEVIHTDTKQAAAQREELPEKRGPKAGTFERIQEAHRLMKAPPYLSRNKAFKRAKTDSRTYDRWCKQATEEEPIAPYSG